MAEVEGGRRERWQTQGSSHGRSGRLRGGPTDQGFATTPDLSVNGGGRSVLLVCVFKKKEKYVDPVKNRTVKDFFLFQNREVLEGGGQEPTSLTLSARLIASNFMWTQ